MGDEWIGNREQIDVMELNLPVSPSPRPSLYQLPNMML
jgi:hypothetical protein